MSELLDLVLDALPLAASNAGVKSRASTCVCRFPALVSPFERYQMDA